MTILWDDYRKEDYIYAQMPIHGKRIAESHRIIRQWLEQCERPYIAVSGGKDSVVMLHLIQTISPTLLPVMWHNSGVEFPGTDDMFDRLIDMKLIDQLHIVKPEYDVIELKRQQLLGEISSAKKDKLALFDPVNSFSSSGNFNGVALGLRREEGRGRSFDGAIHGAIYRKKDGMLRCCPVNHWKWHDIFAYIATNKLPLHPIYSAELLGLENRGRIRLSWWISTDHHLHAELSWLRDNFFETYHKLRCLFPIVKTIT